MNIRTVRNRQFLWWERHDNNNNNNHGFVSQDPPWEAISYLSAFVFAGLQGKKTHTHKVLWEKCTRSYNNRGGATTEGYNNRGGTTPSIVV